MYEYGVVALFSFLVLIQICYAIRTGKQEEAQHHFILVSGNEGSGTTMMTRILSECRSCVGFNNNWKLVELSERAQKKYDGSMKDAITIFNGITDQLWVDSPERTYIEQHVDTRPPSNRLQGCKRAANIMGQAFNEHKHLRSIVHHRSMPHTHLPLTGPRFKTPFLEDIPSFVPDGSAHVVIVIRFMPAAWLSHAHLDDYAPFLARIERLMSGEETIPGVTVSFLSYEFLCCNPRLALEEVVRKLPIKNITDLLSSPSVSSMKQVLFGHENNLEYQKKLEFYTGIWGNVRHLYPAFDRFQSHGELQCNKTFQEEGLSISMMDTLLSRIHQIIED